MNDDIKEKIKAYYVANDIDKIIDYITNLQQENQDLSRMCELYSKSLYNAELTDYKSRCEKAVEYLKKPRGNYRNLNYEPIKVITLINILNGRSDE